MNYMNASRLRSNCTGFTLIEMVTSLVILGILMLALGSVMVMANKATSDGAVRNVAQLQSCDAASQITDDLNVALTFSQSSATAVTFTVPDRLAAGTPQTVTYSWTGVTGDPLLRQFNNGASTALLLNVQKFNMGFNQRLMGPIAGPAEQVIFYHDAVIGTAKDYKLDNKNWGSQYFVPSLPLGTNSYTLTRVRFLLKTGKQSDAVSVGVILPDANFRPTGSTVAQTTLYESGMSSSYEWIDAAFAGLSNQNPLQPLCIVLSSAWSSTDIGSVQIDQSVLSILSSANWSTSSNSGSAWTSGVGTTLSRIYVFGTVP